MLQKLVPDPFLILQYKLKQLLQARTSDWSLFRLQNKFKKFLYLLYIIWPSLMM